jgi:hypothetical protein
MMQSRLERRCIGLDVHREFAQVAIWQGGVVGPLTGARRAVTRGGGCADES